MADTLEDLAKSFLTGGSMHAPQEPYLTMIAEGDIAGHAPWYKNGYTTGATTTETEIWGAASAYVFPTAEMGMEVVSSDNTQDKAGGTGALGVKIYYLTAAGVAKTEIITLNGTTVVPTVATDIYRVNAFAVSSTGTGGKPVGNITLRHLSDTPVYSHITAGYTKDRSAIYTVPAGKTLYVTSIAVSTLNAGADKGCRFTLRATFDDLANGSLTPGVFFMPYFEIGARNGSFFRGFEMPLKFIAGTDIKVSATAEAASTTCTVALRGWLE
jgi:hypothetical protein